MHLVDGENDIENDTGKWDGKKKERRENVKPLINTTCVIICMWFIYQPGYDVTTM